MIKTHFVSFESKMGCGMSATSILDVAQQKMPNKHKNVALSRAKSNK
jgi:hypothetical protein